MPTPARSAGACAAWEKRVRVRQIWARAGWDWMNSTCPYVRSCSENARPAMGGTITRAQRFLPVWVCNVRVYIAHKELHVIVFLLVTFLIAFHRVDTLRRLTLSSILATLAFLTLSCHGYTTREWSEASKESTSVWTIFARYQVERLHSSN